MLTHLFFLVGEPTICLLKIPTIVHGGERYSAYEQDLPPCATGVTLA